MSKPEPYFLEPVVSVRRTLAELRADTIERARHESSLTRAEVSTRNRIVTMGVVLASLIVFVAWGGVRVGPRPDALVAETALGSALLAVGFAIIGLRRGNSMLGRPTSRLVLTVVFAPPLLFAWRVFASSRYPGMMVEWPDRPGLRCFFLTLILALPLLFGALWMRRGSDPVHPYASAGAIGTAVGAGVWVLVDLWCPVGYPKHVMLGHVVPLLVTVGASALFGGRVVKLGGTRRGVRARVRLRVGECFDELG